MNEQIWNEAIFDGVGGDELETLEDAFSRGGLAEYEPLPNDVSRMTEDETIEHAHATRDAWRKR